MRGFEAAQEVAFGQGGVGENDALIGRQVGQRSVAQLQAVRKQGGFDAVCALAGQFGQMAADLLSGIIGQAEV